MTPQEENQARAVWAEKRKRKSYGRLAKMKAKQTEREQFRSIPADRRVWCTNTSRWVVDRAHRPLTDR